jgi:ankyrin repeat protein
MLLAKGGNPNVKNRVGGTPLMWAAVYGHADVVRILLDSGADSRLKDEDGVTASAWALKNGRDDLAQLLREEESK